MGKKVVCTAEKKPKIDLWETTGCSQRKYKGLKWVQFFRSSESEWILRFGPT
jgi:hypothetical protein